MKLRTIIADDEELARERLKRMLSGEDDIEIAGECHDGDEVLALLDRSHFDLLFLDIQMPGCTGLEVVRQIGHAALPATIFLTAFQQYAVDAFELDAVDYLTKPVELGRLRKALARVRMRISSADISEDHNRLAAVLERLEKQSPAPRAFPKRLLVPDGPKDVLIDIESIEWIEASDYYSTLHVGSRSYLLRESLSRLVARLDPAFFLRVHRSAVVNIHQIREIHREGVKEGMLTLQNGRSIRTSKAGRDRLHARHS